MDSSQKPPPPPIWRGRRSQRDAERVRQVRREAVEREVDQIAAQYHALLPSDQAKDIGCIYARAGYWPGFRYNRQTLIARIRGMIGRAFGRGVHVPADDDGPIDNLRRIIGDQMRSLFEWGVKHGVHIPRDHIFFDLGQRGNRPDLDRLQALLNRRSAAVLLVFNSSRLFRQMTKSLRFIEEHVLANKARGVFVASGIDTANELEWRGILAIHAYIAPRDRRPT
jgi:Resolvase, N terminal domain